MKKQNVLIGACAIGLILILSSFITYESGAFATPGTIEFIGDAGSPNVFVFRKWAFDEIKVPDGKLEEMQIALTIQTGSLETQWKDLEKNIRTKKDYFYVKKFPRATIKIDGAEKQPDGSYTTEAMLTLKGVTKPVKLAFSASETVPYQIKGTGVITRQQFKFTDGGPKDEVPISFDITLSAL
jgi:polyisoprenoid-binding protein YceI